MITRTRSIKILNPTPRKIKTIVDQVATISIKHNGIQIGSQPAINFVDTDTIEATVTNDNNAARVDVEMNYVGDGLGVGITLDGANIGGVKDEIETGELLVIPEKWQYNVFGVLDVDGTIINDGEINFD